MQDPSRHSDPSAVGGERTICTHRSLHPGDMAITGRLKLKSDIKKIQRIFETKLGRGRTRNIEKAVVELEQKYGRSVLVS